ncbi:MAG: glycosyltransferase [Planctomycetota bacterium]
MSARTERPLAPSIDIIVPVLDEARLLPGLLEHLTRRPGWNRCIVVDGGSTDASVALARRHPLQPLVLQVPGGRHRQLNRALACSRADAVLVLAADLRLGASALPAMQRCLLAGARHGCLWQRSARRSLLYRWQDACSRLRARHTGGAYMDQTPFFLRRSLLACGGFRNLGSYDTADAGRRLHRPLAVAPGIAISSCRAWHDGFLRPTLANQRKRLQHLGVWPVGRR